MAARRGQGRALERVVAEFSGADTDGLLDRINEDLAVADAPGLGGAADRFNGLFGEFIGAHDLDFHLGKEIHDIFSATIELGMTLLTAKALGFGHRDALEANFLQRLFDFVELERLYDSLDLLHLSLHGSFGGYARAVCTGCASSVCEFKQ